MHLIVGLGNPGGEYARTRHNAGFMAVERLAGRWRLAWDYDKKFDARLARGEVAESRIFLCEPQTYMNSSGEAVGALVRFYRVPMPNLLVAVDDADLQVGELRLRPGGSSGGHHGLESVEEHMGTRDYARLRIGIGRQDGERQIVGHVLGRFSPAEAGMMDKVIDAAASQMECWLNDGIQKAMSRFNGFVTDRDDAAGNEKR